MAQFPPQQCHGGKTPRNSSLRNSSSIKSGISLYSSETVFFYKIFQKFVVFGHLAILANNLPYIILATFSSSVHVIVSTSVFF